MNNQKIKLEKFKRTESRIFTGREEGQKARADSRLDEFDKTEDVIEIIIPEDTMSINSSFFSGMFQKSLKSLGEKKFREKYVFKCEKNFIIDVNIEKNIKICLLMLKNVTEEE